MEGFQDLKSCVTNEFVELAEGKPVSFGNVLDYSITCYARDCLLPLVEWTSVAFDCLIAFKSLANRRNQILALLESVDFKTPQAFKIAIREATLGN